MNQFPLCVLELYPVASMERPCKEKEEMSLRQYQGVVGHVGV